MGPFGGVRMSRNENPTLAPSVGEWVSPRENLADPRTGGSAPMEKGLRGAFPERPPFLLLGCLFTAFYWVALGPAIGGHPAPH